MISRQTNYLKGAITKMKRLFASVISCVLILSLICSGLTVFATTITGAVDTDNFVRGVDVSTLDMLEDLGARFYQNNVESDALTILKNNGANYVRLKLWVDPYDENGNPYGGGNNDYATTLALARRAKNLGMGVLIDFHLSDFWTDPANQIKPKAWKDLSYSELKTTLYNYMKDTLNNFAAAGIVPEMVRLAMRYPRAYFMMMARLATEMRIFPILPDSWNLRLLVLEHPLHPIPKSSCIWIWEVRTLSIHGSLADC